MAPRVPHREAFSRRGRPASNTRSSSPTFRPPTAFYDGEEIARYGDTVIARLQQWWDGLRTSRASRSCKTSWHAAIHMLYERSTGIRRSTRGTGRLLERSASSPTDAYAGNLPDCRCRNGSGITAAPGRRGQSRCMLPETTRRLMPLFDFDLFTIGPVRAACARAAGRAFGARVAIGKNVIFAAPASTSAASQELLATPALPRGFHHARRLRWSSTAGNSISRGFVGQQNREIERLTALRRCSMRPASHLDGRERS